MPILFESLSDGFYSAFFEPDGEKRRVSIDSWIKEATPVIQSAIEKELKTFIDAILHDSWTPQGWQTQAQKFIRPYNNSPVLDSFRLGLDIRLRQRVSTDEIVGARSHGAREEIIQTAKKLLPEVKPNPKKPTKAQKADEYAFEEDSDQRAYNAPSRDDFPDEESYLTSLGQ